MYEVLELVVFGDEVGFGVYFDGDVVGVVDGDVDKIFGCGVVGFFGDGC